MSTFPLVSLNGLSEGSHDNFEQENTNLSSSFKDATNDLQKPLRKEGEQSLPIKCHPLIICVQKMFMLIHYLKQDVHFIDARWVSNQPTERVPIDDFARGYVTLIVQAKLAAMTFDEHALSQPACQKLFAVCQQLSQCIDELINIRIRVKSALLEIGNKAKMTLGIAIASADVGMFTARDEVSSSSGTCDGASDDNGERKRMFSSRVTSILMEWIGLHQDNPYPEKDEKLELCQRTGLTMNQLNNWFVNVRRRKLKRSNSSVAE